MGMTFGLSLPNRGVLFGAMSVEDMYELARKADASPYFSSVWVGDGLIAKPRLEAIVSLAAIATKTSSVRLGVCCMATFPIRDPVLFAVQWASLDLLSKGKTQLAVCLGAPTDRGGGDFQAELEAMGVRATDRVGRFEEALELVRRLWEGPTEFEGRFFRIPEVNLVPKPVQEPCPVWIASNPNPERLSERAYQRAIRRVAVHADGWQTTVATPGRFGRILGDIKRVAEENGRDPSELTSSIHLMINLGEDEGGSREEAKHFLDTYYATDVQPETMAAWGAYGTVERVAERIRDYVDHGLDVPILRFASFDPVAQFQTATDELLPTLIR